MNNINFPISLQFNIATLSNDFVTKDAQGQTIAFVRQKLLKLVDEVNVFSDENKSQLIYNINANKWIDFSTTYVFTDANGAELGRVARKGWASIWKAHYEIFDERQIQDLVIREENGWIKVLDALFSEIPILGILTGYLFNPSYLVSRPDGTQVVRLRKNPSFFGRKFTAEKLADFQTGEEARVILGMMMMILLERRRG